MKPSGAISAGCKLIDAELDGGPESLSEEAAAHLRDCERCRRMYQWFAAKTSRPEASPAILRNIQNDLKRSLRPVKPQPASPALATRLMILFLLLASPVILMMGTAGLHEMTWMQRVVMLSVLTFGAGVLSLSLAWQMTPGSLQRIAPRAAILCLVAGFLLGAAILFPWHAPEVFLTQGWPCLRAGLLVAIPGGALFWLLARRGAAYGAGTLGATLGAIAGLLGTFVLQFHCNIQDAGHMVIWHGGILAVSVGLGILAAGGVERLASHRA
jgi:hypothetical protein